MRGAEEMRADHALGCVDLIGQQVDVEIRRVGRQHRVAPHDRRQRAEHRLFRWQILDHRLDHHVAVVQCLQLVAKGDATDALGVLRRGQAAGLQLAVEHGPHPRLGGQRGLFVHLDQRHVEAGLGHRHRDARAHRSATDHTYPAQRPGRGAGGWAGGDTLGVEQMAQRARLRAGAQLGVDRGLERQALGDRQAGRGRDRLRGADRRNGATRAAFHQRNGGLERGVVVGRHGAVGDARQVTDLGQVAGAVGRGAAQIVATSSTRPCVIASSAGMWRPEVIISRATSGPTRRGRRCVPPAPGMMPMRTSGRPTKASGR